MAEACSNPALLVQEEPGATAATSQTFVELWQDPEHYDERRETLLAYLVRNTVCREILEHSQASNAAEPSDSSTVVALAKFAGLTHSQIAVILGQSRRWVLVQMSDGLARLRTDDLSARRHVAKT